MSIISQPRYQIYGFIAMVIGSILFSFGIGINIFPLDYILLILGLILMFLGSCYIVEF